LDAASFGEVRDKLNEAESGEEIANMISGMLMEYVGHHDDHHGSGGPEEMYKEYFDPERANQQVIDAIPGYIDTLPERYGGTAAEKPTPPQIVELASQEIVPDLMNLGFAAADLELIMDYLRKHVENIRSLEDFLMGLAHGLTMIAYGYPELIDPTPSVMLMLELKDYRT
jgi:hypothetical protein